MRVIGSSKIIIKNLKGAVYFFTANPVSTGHQKSTFLIQQPEVHLHPKAQAALGHYFVESHASDGKRFVLETHSDFIVDRVRDAISKKIISPDDVLILFFERKPLENTITQIEIDSQGEPIDPPESYRSFFIGEQLRLLGVE